MGCAAGLQILHTAGAALPQSNIGHVSTLKVFLWFREHSSDTRLTFNTWVLDKQKMKEGLHGLEGWGSGRWKEKISVKKRITAQSCRQELKKE